MNPEPPGSTGLPWALPGPGPLRVVGVGIIS